MALLDIRNLNIEIQTPERTTVFGDVIVRAVPGFVLELHIDTDEANAAKIATGNTVTIIK